MPDTGLLFVSGVCLLTATLCILFPDMLGKLSVALNRTVTVLDQSLLQHRYMFGLLLFLMSYLFFRLALLVPGLRG